MDIKVAFRLVLGTALGFYGIIYFTSFLSGQYDHWLPFKHKMNSSVVNMAGHVPTTFHGGETSHPVTEPNSITSGRPPVTESNSRTSGSYSFPRSRPKPSTPAHPTHARPQVTKLVLVTYFRGGSTFLGELVNQNPDAFYMFEPLIAPYDRWVRKLKKQKLMQGDPYHDARGQLNAPGDMIREMARAMHQILDCDFYNLDPSILGHYFQVGWKKSLSMLPYQNCMRDKTPGKKKKHLTKFSSVEGCIPALIQACESSSIRAFKTIRVAAVLAEQLLQEDPSIKLVYYTRDPRGMFVSRANFWRTSSYRQLHDTQKVNETSTVLCRRSRHDMVTFDGLRSHYSIVQMRYEDLALGPGKTAIKLYKFIHRPVPETVSKWIEANTQAQSKNGIMGTRRNSSETAEKWRDILPKKSHEIIVANCQDVIKYQGYTL